MWFATPDGVRIYDGKRFVNLTIEAGLREKQVNIIHCDASGILWFGTNDSGVFRYDGKRFLSLTTRGARGDLQISPLKRVYQVT